MDSRAQTTFEYLLLVGGVVILAMTVIYFLTESVKGSASEVNATIGSIARSFSQKVWDVLEQIHVG